MVVTDVDEANFDLVAKFGGLFFGFGDASFVTLGKLNFDWRTSATLWWTPQSHQNFGEPFHVDMAEQIEGLWGFDGLDPLFALLVPVVGEWTGKNLNPHLFLAVWIEFSERTGDAGERVNFEGLEGFDRESFVFSECNLGAISDRIIFTTVDVIVFHAVNLDAWVLRIDLPFYK